GWPQSVRLGIGLLNRLPEFKSHLDRPGELRRAQPEASLIADTRALTSVDRWYADVKLDLSRREFLQAVGGSEACNARIAAIVFPRIAPEFRKMRIRSVNEHEARERFSEQLLSPAGGSAFNWLGLRKDDATRARERAIEKAAEIARATPAFEVTAGPALI